MYYTIYKTTNLINGKIYIGFHSIKDLECILYIESVYDSIFSDGYLGSGRLIKQALEKYGPENMRQELLLVTDDLEEAEEVERKLVNKEFVEDINTYNLSIGGNICILYGENNGFYGKKHSKETIEYIQFKRNQRREELPFSWCETYDVATNEKFITYSDVIDYYNIDTKLSKTDIKYEIYKLIHEGKLKHKNIFLENIAITKYKERLEWIATAGKRREQFSILISKRFKGIPKTEESNEKRGKSISNWIRNNPEAHTERMNKINKNPQKIQKMVEKQTGKIWIRNIETGVNTRQDPSLTIPEGWIRGFKKNKGLK